MLPSAMPMLAVNSRCQHRDLDRGGDLLEQALRDDGRLRRFADRGQEHGKLVTAEPRHRVAGPNHGLEPRSQDREHFVADAVPVLVVDLLELVEVDEDHRGTRLVLRTDRDRVLELLVEESPIGEPGERIEQCL